MIMCGICGVAPLSGKGPVDPGLMERMASSMAHRGPDDSGFQIEDGIGLGHRRLSIVDLSRGHQPMCNEDGSIWIVFNGEIYNHDELRPDLEARGHRYRTLCDTETIIHLYEEYGEECVSHLRGMFAFAIWNRNTRSLFLARDRLGIKPLYYGLYSGRLIFASEIKAILEYPGFPREMNIGALPEFLALRYLTGERTLFEIVRKLLPGHTLSLQEGVLRIRRYWDIDYPLDSEPIPEERAIEEFRALFEEAVKLRLMSDVPLGMFLSGGLDSSSIAATMARMMDRPLKTFSIGFSEAGCSELPYAREVARRLGAEHQEITIGVEEFMGTLPRLVWHHDEPICFSASVPLYYISDAASRSAKVVLSGEGGDEMLAGYGRYAATVWNLRMGRWFPDWAREHITGPLVQALPLSARWKNRARHTFLFQPSDLRRLYLDNFLAAFTPDLQHSIFAPGFAAQLDDSDPYGPSLTNLERRGGDALNQLLYSDAKGYLVELLMKQDKMSMAASIESRVPLLDHKLVEFCAKLPVTLKLRGGVGKYLLKRATEGLLPNDIIHRPKMGFPVPLNEWFRGSCCETAASVLLDPSSDRGIFDQRFIEGMLSQHARGNRNWSEHIWTLLNLELWLRTYIDGHGPLGALSVGKSEVVVS